MSERQRMSEIVEQEKLKGFLGSDLHDEMLAIGYEYHKNHTGPLDYRPLKKQLFDLVLQKQEYYTDDFRVLAYYYINGL
jgi:hypothetical protein